MRRSGFSPKGYRPEIDGLRAIAVLSVLLYHLDLPFISAGFIGVDVFFVISGFLITSILMQDLAEGRFNLLRFYRKRALRILPPLILMLVVMSALALIVMLPGEIRSMAQAVGATLGFASNVFFWTTSDYFTPEAKENPFLHTWSLGVEEQFYIVLPILLWLLYRWCRPHSSLGGLKLGLTLTVLVSFCFGSWSVGSHPQAAFYLLPARYWEMGAGAMLSVLLPNSRMRPVYAEALGAGGVFLIGAALLLLTPASSFPGINALWPVLGAVAVIAAGGATVSGRMLSLPPMLFLGRISYSLYLWHWPLIVLWKLHIGGELAFVDQLGLGLVSMAMATASTHWVEAPLRHLPQRISDLRVLLGSGAVLGVMACLALGMQTAPERLRNYPPEVLALERYSGFHASTEFIAWNRRHQCFLSDDTKAGFDAFDEDLCLGHPADKQVLLMLGDSLSAHLWHAMRDAYPEYSVVQADASGCRPFLESAAYPACAKLLQFVYETWVPYQKPDLVVLSARWQDGEEVLLVDAVKRLKQGGAKRVVVLGPTVEYKGDLAKLLARDLLTGQNKAAHMTDPARWRVSADLQAALQDSRAEYVDMLALLCPDGQCKTWAPSVQGAEPAPMSFDYGHYTPEGAAYVAAALGPVLR